MSVPAEQVTGKTTTIQALKPAADPEAHLPSVNVGFTSLQSFQLILRVSKMFADSTIVPERFRGNLANCAIALEMAYRLGASPLMIMQSLYIVHGNPGWSAKFLIASFNQCGRFSSIRYKFQGTRGKDDWGARAWAIEKSTGERLEGPLIDIELTKKEGWYNRKDSKWQTMPEQMLRYRSGAWFINTVAPEISMGLRTTDEIEDMGSIEARRDAAGQFAVDLESLRPAPPEPGSAEFDAAAAIALIKASKTLKELESAYTPIVESLVASNQAVPIEVETAYGDRKAALEQAE